jgi:hypothetical protein
MWKGFRKLQIMREAFELLTGYEVGRQKGGTRLPHLFDPVFESGILTTGKNA